MKRPKFGDKIKLNLEIEVEVVGVWNNAIEVYFLNTENPSIEFNNECDLVIFNECIKDCKDIKN